MSKTVIIIGGSGGIGRNLVNQFCIAGYDVIFTYNTSEPDSIYNRDNCMSYKLDVMEEKAIGEFADYLREEHKCINALVYASGIFEDGLTDKMELESWNRVISINLTGAFLLTKYLLPLLRQSGNGRIIYIGSVMGEAGCYGSSSYSVTKAGLIALAKSVALENAKKNVTANVLSFGYIDTGMTAVVSGKVLESAMERIPMKRLGDPSDAARVAVDLCSDHMNYISGQTIRVNGALYI